MTTIGFFSPSTPITATSPQRFARAQNFLQAAGYQFVAGALTGQADGYRSGSIQARVAELNALIHDPQVDILMATIGGMNSNAMLPYLDYDYLNAHPKTIVGYSDVTALLLAIYTQAPNCRVLYGPTLVAGFGEWSPIVEESLKDFQAVLAGDTLLQAPTTWTDDHTNWETFVTPKQMHANHWGYTQTPQLSGRIIGGNLNTMSGFIHSPYFPQLSHGDLLFIEDAEKDAATVERSFAMLKNAGIFDQVRGVILGKHALFDDAKTGRAPIDILLEVLNGQPLPVIYDYDSCHTVPMMTTPIGDFAEFDAVAQTVRFTKSR
ncbi:S66 family peptidase [Lacticaseibacillus manihotivorans]|jgi:muramoyltetrapeptide carboxypeptidase LdcA involved in peptidoglycan recycling|uniref:Microcin immunity protein n=2 Tax=Lacticaseibacillus manihotivorans TaxID=88233 RepID=A0A0R1QAF2_9LACO|nr:S66 peptidase family protein [Lacticaseibacillus manihotivorans]KRL39860.1 microcin immunity protein [Lacticaseibacillus manihotivorans DSM 13343 = JCM 12514]QFQ92074.1 LD-carboxypeptidase [Lacticaseibacillus manihotivorans]